jgi:hypothetical protein
MVGGGVTGLVGLLAAGVGGLLVGGVGVGLLVGSFIASSSIFLNRTVRWRVITRTWIWCVGRSVDMADTVDMVDTPICQILQACLYQGHLHSHYHI